MFKVMLILMNPKDNYHPTLHFPTGLHISYSSLFFGLSSTQLYCFSSHSLLVSVNFGYFSEIGLKADSMQWICCLYMLDMCLLDRFPHKFPIANVEAKDRYFH